MFSYAFREKVKQFFVGSRWGTQVWGLAKEIREDLRLLWGFLHAPFLRDPSLKMDLTDGFLRMGITANCNAKCRFCQYWERHAIKTLDMPNEYLYQYCLPLYEKIKVLSLTDGEALVAKEFYNFCEFISKNYPALTIALETNCIAFSQKAQELAIDNLFSVSISLNAITEKTYVNGVWASSCPGGKQAFPLIQKHYAEYMNRLKEKSLLAFAPGISMVINKDTNDEVYDFIRFSLETHAGSCTVRFDFTEVPRDEGSFSNPIFEQTLEMLCEISRILQGKFKLYYKLYIPTQICERVQKKANEIPLEELKSKYSEIMKLAEGRSIFKEYEERQRIRRDRGKKTFTFEEELGFALQTEMIDGEPSCCMPWKELDIRPASTPILSGKYGASVFESSPYVTFCGWMKCYFRMGRYLHNGKMDWDALMNSSYAKMIRRNIRRKNFSACMECCPLNGTYHKVVTVTDDVARGCCDEVEKGQKG